MDMILPNDVVAKQAFPGAGYGLIALRDIEDGEVLLSLSIDR